MRVRFVGSAVVAVGLLLSACGGGGEEPEGLDGSPSDSAPATTPAETPSEPSKSPKPTKKQTEKEKILSDYEAAMDASVAAYDPPNVQDPDLIATHNGELLEATQDELKDLKAKGHSEVVSYEGDAMVAVNDPGGVAVVRDCFNITVRTVDTKTGGEVDTGEVEGLYDTTLELKDGTWIMVSRSQLEETCTSPT